MQPVFGREGDPNQAVIIASSSIFGRSVPEIAMLSAPEFATYCNLSISSLSKFATSRCQISLILDSEQFWVPSCLPSSCHDAQLHLANFCKFRLCHRYRGPARADFTTMLPITAHEVLFVVALFRAAPRGFKVCRLALRWRFGGFLFAATLRRRLALGTPKSALHPPP